MIIITNDKKKFFFIISFFNLKYSAYNIITNRNLSNTGIKYIPSQIKYIKQITEMYSKKNNIS